MGGILRSAVRLEAINADGQTLDSSDLMTIARDLARAHGADFGLKVSESKVTLVQLEERIA